MPQKQQERSLVHADMHFPLNVYAHCLYLEEGHVDCLHYGLFDETHQDCSSAQQQSTALLQQYLPKPCRVLEIGSGLGTTAIALTQQGYQLTTLTPDPAQINIVKQRLKTAKLSDKVTVEQQWFEKFTAKAQSFDLLLLQESSQYLDSLQLFQRATEWLSDEGEILIVDEFSFALTAKDNSDSLTQLKHVKAQAERFGFRCEAEVDLSQKAAPTNHHLLRVIRKHKAQLLRDLPISKAQLDTLLASIKYYHQRYEQKRYGYALLHFKKYRNPRWLVSEAKASDETAIRGLFERVFGYTMTQSFWQWKYADGRSVATLAWRNGELVAHYGGLLRHLHYFGKKCLGVQIGDVMVDPKERGILTKRGAFNLAAATFPERYVGYGQRILIGYGFPNKHAMKVAVRMGFYGKVGQMTELQWQPESSRPRLKSQIREWQPTQEPKAEGIINQLWQAMSADLSQAIVGVRDWAYIQQRYCQHPEKQYKYLLIQHRFNQQPLALVVLRIDDDKVCRLLDYVGALEHCGLAILHTKRMLSHWDIEKFTLWISRSFKAHFAHHQAIEQTLEVDIPTSIWTKGPSVEEVKDKWWLMGGDGDFN